MRKYMQETKESPFRIIAVDDEQGILDSISVLLKRSGYDLVCVTDPTIAVQKVREEHFDIMLLDFIMMPIHGDEVVKQIREFNSDLYILLLTGHKDLAPPLDTIKRLQIQGYCEKSNNLDQLVLLVESAVKSVEQMRIITQINEDLTETNQKLQQAHLDLIETLKSTVEAKDVYTKGHSDRVAEFSVLIGTKLGIEEHGLNTLRLGGLFHDVGKIGIPDSILLKESKLDDEEYTQIKNHPSIGAHILGNSEAFEEIIPIVLHHHERYDGRGYPAQLQGENIPYLARIAAVADAFDAMTSKRTYRDSLPIDIVKQEIEKNLGIQFDPVIGQTFLDILNNNSNEVESIQNKYR